MGDDQETSARTIDGYIDVQSRGNFATTHLDNHLCEAEMETGRLSPFVANRAGHMAGWKLLKHPAE